jgi:hypothetical protein
MIIATAKKHTLALELCYCSINSRCWELKDTLGAKTAQLPHTVNACALNSSIAAEPLQLPAK